MACPILFDSQGKAVYFDLGPAGTATAQPLPAAPDSGTDYVDDGPMNYGDEPTEPASTTPWGWIVGSLVVGAIGAYAALTYAPPTRTPDE